MSMKVVYNGLRVFDPLWILDVEPRINDQKKIRLPEGYDQLNHVCPKRRSFSIHGERARVPQGEGPEYKEGVYRPWRSLHSIGTVCVSAMFSFPSRLQSLVNEMLRTNTKLEQVRKLSIGGSLVTETLARRAVQVFPNLHNLRNFYGLTESCGIISVPGQDEINFVDLGVPAPNVEIKVLSSDKKELMGPNQPGELLFRMPSLMRGYYKKPKETAAVLLKDGWCNTGDMGYYNDDGRLHFLERLKEMIKCMDNQVVPAELENLILDKCPAVAEVSVLGLPHPEYGEVAAAFVVLHDYHKDKVTEEDIKKIVSGQFEAALQLVDKSFPRVQA
ncbi:hypothetical protein HPB49_005713 [Dermacentor silvarum]|uniref:Uncharacterized protein n=1 Tax=Dermacentor silvarum TaxID=543639 RepID=A0ACB8C7I0_DERSI|nr:hypothetical protein HPB49_005713 [Dermacentor silvarum]